MSRAPDEEALWKEAFGVPDAFDGDHPSDEELFAAAVGERPPERVAELLAHVRACGQCAESWRLAAAIDASAREDAPAVPAPANRQRYLRWLAVAAAVLVIVAAALSVREADRPLPEWRAGEPRLAVVAAGATDPLPRSDARLIWQAVPGASAYEVTIVVHGDDGGDVRSLLHVEVEATELVVAPGRFDGVPAGAALVWTVRAVGVDATPLLVRTRLVDP